jgi:hypothetical protein
MERELKEAGVVVEHAVGRLEFAAARIVPPSESRFADRPVQYPPEILEHIRRNRGKRDRNGPDAA